MDTQTLIRFVHIKMEGAAYLTFHFSFFQLAVVHIKIIPKELNVSQHKHVVHYLSRFLDWEICEIYNK